MKGAALFLVTAAVVVSFAGVALALEASGVVTAVNVEKSMITLKSETMAVSYDCETGSLLKGIKVGDWVTVKYTEEGGRKLATSVTRVSPKKEESPAPYNPPGY
jgi:hypothetical protein